MLKGDDAVYGYDRNVPAKPLCEDGIGVNANFAQIIILRAAGSKHFAFGLGAEMTTGPGVEYDLSFHSGLGATKKIVLQHFREISI